MTKLLTIDLRSTAHRMLGSRGNPSQFVLYGLKNMCAKFDAFTRFVTIFPLTDRTKKHRAISNQEKMALSPPPLSGGIGTPLPLPQSLHGWVCRRTLTSQPKFPGSIGYQIPLRMVLHSTAFGRKGAPLSPFA